MIRRDTDHAIRMLVQLATHAPGGLSAAALSSQLDVPHGFAQKILRTLAHAGLLEARPGRQGGFALRRAPAEVSLMEVVVAVQGPPLVNRCTGEGEACALQSECPVSASLRTFQDKLNGFLRSTKLSSIVQRQKAKGRRQKARQEAEGNTGNRDSRQAGASPQSGTVTVSPSLRADGGAATPMAM